MKNGEHNERTHAERTKSDLDQSKNDTIKVCILGALKMKRKLKNRSQSDVRIFSVVKGS